MPDFPRNVMEFHERFATEEDCEDYLFDCRWPEGFVCPRCGNTDYRWVGGRRKLLRCTACNYQVSLTAGTVMHGTKMPLRTWFIGAYLVTTQTPGMSAVQFQRQTGIRTYETAFNMLHKLRAAMVRPDRDRIHGVVEVDETYIGGKKKGKTGRGAAGKVIVAGAVEVREKRERTNIGRRVKKPKKTYAGRLRLRILDNVTEREITSFVLSNVEEGSVVRTDDFLSYNALPIFGYKRRILDPKSLTHIHRTFSNLKTWLKGTHHGVSRKHLQAYLNEFVFRHNRRRNPMRAFMTVLGLGSHLRAPTYEELYKAGEEEGWEHPNPWG